MRSITFILAMLILLLNCVPCADASETACLPNDTHSANGKQTKETTEHNDACTPFCHCACCANTPVVFPATDITVTTTFTAQYFERYIDRLIQISLPVWQPPQLV
ncbi:MAG: hypothetical protein QM731_26660 [Chitinophagaceae bacterium]